MVGLTGKASGKLKRIEDVVRKVFLTWGYAEGVYLCPPETYERLLRDTQERYNMTPEEYLKSKGLNTKIEIR